MIMLFFPASSQPLAAEYGQNIEVAFSPDAGAEALVVKVITAARKSIRLAAYSFTSPSVVRALMEAHKRGVDVAVLVDYKANIEDNRTEASRKALGLLERAGIPVKTISSYSIHHDKYIIVDDQHVETGSYNFTAAAAKYNSENVIVVWNDSAIANQYKEHWQSRWQQSN